MKRAAIVLLALLLAACAPDTGVVTQKQYSPARTWTTIEPIYGTQCTGSGTALRCSQVVTGMVPREHYSPESWDVKITDGKDTGWVSVSERTYDLIRVGDTYDSKTGEVS